MGYLIESENAAVEEETVEESVAAAGQSVNRINDMVNSIWDSFVGKLPTIIIAIAPPTI